MAPTRKFSLKNSVAAALAAALLHAGATHAAGLGRLNVLSNMGQPFVGEIELVNVAKDELGTIKASLAPTAAYQAANLRFDPALNSLRLSVEQRANGTPYVRATSTRPVTEPYIDLVIDLTSPSGGFRRQYSALLDPSGLVEQRAPTAVTAAPAAATPPVATPAQATPGPASRPAPRPAAPSAIAPPAAPAAVAAAPAARTPAAAPAAATVTPPSATPPTAASGAATQTESKPAESAKAETAKAKPEATPAAAEAPQAATPQAETKAAEAAPTEPPPAAEAQKKVAPPPPAAPSAPQRGIVAWVMDHLATIVGGALALLAGIAGLWALSRRKQTGLSNQTSTRPAPSAAPMFKTQPRAQSAATSSAGAVAAAAAPVPVSEEPTVANVTDSVDPLEEAQVYLDHGADEQAEEVLRKALAKEPQREAVKLKLAEILAARGDKSGFGKLATELHQQTGVTGDVWKRVTVLGATVDPTNPLFAAASGAAAPATQKIADNGLDFDLGSPAPQSAAATVNLGSTTDILLSQDSTSLDMEKTMVLTRADIKATAPAPAPAEPLPDVNFELPKATPDGEKPAAAPKDAQDHVLEYKIDFPNVNLNLDGTPPPEINPAFEVKSSQWEEVQQKFDLALAYQEMGDKEGMIEALQEIEREGDAAQKAQAQKMIQDLKPH